MTMVAPCPCNQPQSLNAMKKSALILGIGLALASCTRETETNVNYPVADSFDQLSVSSDFNWSTSLKENMQISFDLTKNPNIQLEGAEIWLLDNRNERVARSVVRNNKTSLNIALPANTTGYKLYLNATKETWPLEVSKRTTLTLADPFDLSTIATKGKVLGKGAFSSSNPPGTNLVANADFETSIPNANRNQYYFSPYHIGVDQNEWFVIDNDFNQSTENGSKVFKAKNNRSTYCFQNITVTPGDSLFINADHSSDDAYAYLFFWDHANSSSWSSYEFSYLNSDPDGITAIVPTGKTVATILLYVSDKAWVDNAWLSNPPAITDTDGDGVADDQDDFPNDASKAYLSYYPTTGRQTIAFEDMWPVKGDYDFNDMIVNSKMTLIKNASNEWVSAEVSLALDAFGGGIENGLAIQLVDANKNAMSNLNISVSGDASLDPDVSNGIIVFSDPDQIRTDYYSNTESGSLATPDTAKFTITFGTNNGANFIPDFYIFQTLDRSVEVHLPGFAGTSEANTALNNTGDDVNGTYQTTNGLPWGMELVLPEGTNFKHPYEKIDMITAYPQFSAWASSNGTTNADWYQTPNLGDVIDLTQ